MMVRKKIRILARYLSGVVVGGEKEFYIIINALLYLSNKEQKFNIILAIDIHYESTNIQILAGPQNEDRDKSIYYIDLSQLAIVYTFIQ